MLRPDYSLRYEYLARAVFNCERAGDEKGYANADLYGATTGSSVPDELRDALALILARIQNSADKSYNKRFENLHRAVNSAKGNEEVDIIIDQATALAQELGYDIMDA